MGCEDGSGMPGNGAAPGIETKGRALIGSLVYREPSGAFMPAILLDLSQEPELSERAERLYKSRWFNRVTLHVEGKEGEVSVEAVHDLLDGRRLENLVVRFSPEDPDDIDAFLGLLEITRSWILAVRVPKGEMHFVVMADTDEIVDRYRTGRSEMRRIELGEHS